jgi:cell division protein FtsB
MRWLTLLLFLALAGLQYSFWFGTGGVQALWHLQRTLKAQRLEVQAMTARNKVLAAEVIDLQQGTGALEERARQELGMVKEGEVLYQINNPQPK